MSEKRSDENRFVNEPTHCPYLGLRQNRAIRFAAPTPEHRCFRNGMPDEIPVDQRSFCLSPQHRTCPLYTGQWDASMQPVGPALAVRRPAMAGQGLSSGISGRDRTFFVALITLFALIATVWLVVWYLYTLDRNGNVPVVPVPPVERTAFASITTLPGPSVTASPTARPSVTPVPTTRATATPTETAVPSPTALPVTSTPNIIVLPTLEPPTATDEPFVPEPTPSPDDTILPEPTLEPSPAITETATLLPVETPTESPVPSSTPTATTLPTPTNTIVPTPTNTIVPTATVEFPTATVTPPSTPTEPAPDETTHSVTAEPTGTTLLELLPSVTPTVAEAYP